MNFLAHLWLADRTGTSLAGSVLGDVVRGADLSAYPDDIAHGVRLHRRVDAATDRHASLVELRQTFVEGERRYAGIVLDLACDYALAQDWKRYRPAEALSTFCARAGTALEQASPWFVKAGGRAIDAGHFAQLLHSYGTSAGIERALQRTAARLRQPQPLLQAGAQWQALLPELRARLPDVLDDLRTVMNTARDAAPGAAA